jgi:hypothetical protein
MTCVRRLVRHDASRRAFVAAALGLPVAAAIPIAQAAPATPAPAGEGARGYRETEHVITYYRAAARL